ncbi:MAG: signal peptidase II [Cyclobacteriaceae bacterium]|nr:signal peptidase II [Cyclobacteriaceae bacterium]
MLFIRFKGTSGSMEKRKKRTVVMAMMGAIIGTMFSIVFSNSNNMMTIIPVAFIIGGLIGTIIDRRKSKDSS